METNLNPGIEIILSDMREKFMKIYGQRLARMVLFGSHARGDAVPDSDIDVLVALKGKVSPEKEIAGTIDVVAEISLEWNVVVSCVFVSEEQFERENSPLLINVRREGVPV